MPAAAPSGPGSRTSDPFSLDLANRLKPHTTDRGVFYTVDDEPPLAVQHHPLVPMTTKSLPSAGGQAHGFVIEKLTTKDLEPSDPVIVRPTVDLAAHEPELAARNPYFPAQLATVTSEATPAGRRDRLTLAAGQYRGDHQRLFTAVDGRVLRSTGDDFTPLVIRRVDGEVTGGTFAIRVEVEGGDALGGTVLYRTDADTGPVVSWHRADLAAVNGNLLATGGALPNGTRIVEAIVQAYDTGYNVSLSDYKVLGYSFAAVPQPDPSEGPDGPSSTPTCPPAATRRPPRGSASTRASTTTRTSSTASTGVPGPRTRPDSACPSRPRGRTRSPSAAATARR